MGVVDALNQKSLNVTSNSATSFRICQSHPPKYGCCAKLFSFFSNSKPFTPAAGEAETPFGVGVVEGLLALGLLTNSTVTGPSLQRFTFQKWSMMICIQGMYILMEPGVMYVNTRISKFIKHSHRYSSLPDVCVENTFLKWSSQIDIQIRNIAVSIRWCTLSQW